MSSFESFYGGRQGASFVIVKKFDGLDIPENTNVRSKWFAQDENGLFYVPLVPRTGNNFKSYPNWGKIPCDGHTTVVSAQGVESEPLDLEYQEGMKQCFEKGGDTTTIVNYGEYVIIDTIFGRNELNSPDNGKIYRRGMNYDYNAATNPLCGAEYIGQVVGPRGTVSSVDMETIKTISENPFGVVKQYEPTTGDQKDGIVPGRYFDGSTGEAKYNDVIDYGWATVRDPDGNIEGVLIGFNFPYLVPEFFGGFRSPYYTQEDLDEGRIVDPALIGTPIQSNLDLFVDNGYDLDNPDYGETGHPFYRKWKITIPKGIKGDTMTELKVFPTIVVKGAELEDLDTGDIYVSDEDLSVNVSSYWDTFRDGYVTVTTTIEGEEKTLKAKLEDTANLHYGYLFTWYDDHENGQDHEWLDVGPYRVITRTNLSADGWLSIYYSADYTDPVTGYNMHNPDVLGEALRWIWLETDPEKTKGVQMDEDGSVTIWYNTLDDNGDHEFQKYDNIMSWLDALMIQRNGHFIATYNNETLYDAENPYSYGHPGWSKVTGHASWETDLTWPTQASLNEAGVLKFLYNNNLLDDIYPEGEPIDGTVDRVEGSYSFILPWIVQTKLLQDGHFNFKFNNDRLYDETDPDWDENDHTLYKPMITWITKARMTDNGVFKLFFNNDLNKEAVIADGGTWNDEEHSYSKQLLWIRNIEIGADGTLTFIRCDNTRYTGAYKIKWINDTWIDVGETEGTGDQKIHVRYNNDTTAVIGNPINYIVETTVGKKDNEYGIPDSHLLVWYADPAYRNYLITTYPERVYYFKGTKDTEAKNGWFDIGNCKGEPGGIHIIGNLESVDDLYNDGPAHTDPKTPEDIGGDDDYAGWVVTIGDGSSDPLIYAYDYDRVTWYSLGTVGSALFNPEITIVASNISETPTTLNTNGFWCVTKPRKYAI